MSEEIETIARVLEDVIVARDMMEELAKGPWAAIEPWTEVVNASAHLPGTCDFSVKMPDEEMDRLLVKASLIMRELMDGELGWAEHGRKLETLSKTLKAFTDRAEALLKDK